MDDHIDDYIRDNIDNIDNIDNNKASLKVIL